MDAHDLDLSGEWETTAQEIVTDDSRLTWGEVLSIGPIEDDLFVATSTVTLSDPQLSTSGFPFQLTEKKAGVIEPDGTVLMIDAADNASHDDGTSEALTKELQLTTIRVVHENTIDDCIQRPRSAQTGSSAHRRPLRWRLASAFEPIRSNAKCKTSLSSPETKTPETNHSST